MYFLKTLQGKVAVMAGTEGPVYLSQLLSWRDSLSSGAPSCEWNHLQVSLGTLTG